jgi:hypothetical protein
MDENMADSTAIKDRSAGTSKEKLIEFLFIDSFFSKLWNVDLKKDDLKAQDAIGIAIIDHVREIYDDKNYNRLIGDFIISRGKYSYALEYGAASVVYETQQLFEDEHLSHLASVASVDSTNLVDEKIYQSYLFSLLIEEEIIETITDEVIENDFFSNIDDNDFCFYNLVDWLLSFPQAPTKHFLKSTLPPILATFLFRVWKLLMMTNSCSKNCDCNFCQLSCSHGEKGIILWKKFNDLLRWLDESDEKDSKEKEENGKYFQLFNSFNLLEKTKKEFDFLPTVLTNIICEYVDTLILDEDILREKIFELSYKNFEINRAKKLTKI